MKHFFSGICLMIIMLKSSFSYFFDASFFYVPPQGTTYGTIVQNNQTIITFGSSSQVKTSNRYLQQLNNYQMYYGSRDPQKNSYFSNPSKFIKADNIWYSEKNIY